MRESKCGKCCGIFSSTQLEFCDRGCDTLLCPRCRKVHVCGEKAGKVSTVAPEARLVKDAEKLIGETPTPTAFEVVAADLVPLHRLGGVIDPQLEAFGDALRALPVGRAIRWRLNGPRDKHGPQKQRVKNYIMRLGLKMTTATRADRQWLYVWRVEEPAKKAK